MTKIGMYEKYKKYFGNHHLSFDCGTADNVDIPCAECPWFKDYADTCHITAYKDYKKHEVLKEILK